MSVTVLNPGDTKINTARKNLGLLVASKREVSGKRDPVKYEVCRRETCGMEKDEASDGGLGPSLVL